MPRVNLLPWREALRQQQKQHYLATLLGVALAVGAIVWAIGQGVDGQIAHQQSRNDYLAQEIAVLDSQIAEIQKIKENKNAIEQRMALIEQLQISRNIAPAVFDELAKLVPDGVAFRSMKRTGSVVEVNGLSDSNNRLSEFMRRIEISKVFEKGELSSIKADTSANDSVNDFTLLFTISPALFLLPDKLTQGGQ